MRTFRIVAAIATFAMANTQSGSAAPAGVLVPAAVVAPSAGAPSVLTDCAITRSGVLGLPEIRIQNRNALRTLVSERVRIRGFDPAGRLIGQNTLEWLDVEVHSGETGALSMEAAQTYVAFDHFTEASAFSCELVAAGFDDNTGWRPGIIWKKPLLEAAYASTLKIASIESWTSPSNKDGAVAHVRLQLDTDSGAVTVRPNDFVASLQFADGGVQTFRGLDVASPSVKQQINRRGKAPAIGRYEDLGALGSLTVEPHRPKTVVVTYVVSEAPLAAKPFVGVEYKPAP